MTDQPTNYDPTQITCQEMESFIDDYLEANLSNEQREAFDSHMQYCPDCVNFLTNYRNAVILGKNAYTDQNEKNCEQIPESLVQAIMEVSKLTK